MATKITKKSKNLELFDSLKKKLIDFGVDYLKENLKFSKEDISRYVEGHIKRKLNRKIKKEVRTYMLKYFSYALLGLGLCFVVYFVLDLVVYLLEVPGILTNLLFGLFLLLFGMLLYLTK